LSISATASRRGIVGQAQDREIGLVERLAPRACVLAPRLVEHEQLELAPAGEPVGDLEPGRAGAAVDENRRGHARNCSSRSSRI
jgi:hypothetical protein